MRRRSMFRGLAALVLATSIVFGALAVGAGAQTAGPNAPSVPGSPLVAQGFRSAQVGWHCSTGWTPGCPTKWAMVDFTAYLPVTSVKVRVQEFTTAGPVWRQVVASVTPAKTGWTVVVSPQDAFPQAFWRQIEITAPNPYFPGYPATTILWAYF